MTPFPYSIGLTDTVGAALALMRDGGFRHLPVVDHFRCVGLVSYESVLTAVERAGVGGVNLHVEQVTLPDPYVVDIGTPLEEVLTHMAENGVLCAVVVRAEKVVGIFTGVDACRLLLKLLPPSLPPDDAA
jgi:CBS domain-containing protein